MAFSIKEFESNISRNGGVARTAHFDMIVIPPGPLRERADFNNLTMRIESTSIPGRSAQTLLSRYWGPARKMAYQPLHNDVAVSIICSANLIERDLFMSWQDLMIGRYRNRSFTYVNGPYDVGYYDDYVGNATIRQYDHGQERTILRYFHLKEIYPLNVNPMEAHWGSNDVHRVNVLLASREFEEYSESESRPESLH